MADASQNPGTLSIGFRRGETFAEVIDVSIDMTGYTVTSDLVSVVSGATIAPITTTFVDAGLGQIQITLSSSQTAGLAPGTYAWRQTWVAPGGVAREGLTGFVEVRP